MPSEMIPAPSGAPVYKPNEILLYGVKLNDKHDFAEIPFDSEVTVQQSTIALRLLVQKTGDALGTKPVERDRVSIIVAYGYAYEGGCYRFDKPRLLLFAPASEEANAQGCGFEGFNPPYKMWRITAKTMLLEVATSVGLAEDLVLTANLPANRPPNTYGNHMELAHRGGKLNRGGG
ncbi:hypothetical protein [Ancylobacter amanitiformis]|uniref:Uncharacterized protein n=1 Tax=Ancylobacter amanitiformis TaxID=217069 RepID=A0ABU0LLP5_9HYPH|nr:hypothetical protein [Ancylobacter amanitiformis]MDQ0509598.1 hypothetical protein [Ancylobacter amanitiformis]